MKQKLFPTLILSLLLTGSLSARTLFVATTGNDNAAGTKQAPFATPNKAVSVVQPGDTIYVREGTYLLTTTIRVKAAQNARQDARICLWAHQEPGKAAEKVVFDGSQIPSTNVNEFKMSRCIYQNHEANYWHYKGLELCNANDNGMKMEGSYNIIENCKFYGNNDTGLQIGMFKDFSIEETKSFPISGTPPFNPGYNYCKYNVIINCDAYDNYDSKSYGGGSDDGGDADGFAAKLFPGPGTEFHGCRGWNNSDDNWDLYMVYHPILIDNCWSYKGGYDKNNIARGNGNGFKLGGGGTSGGAAFAQSVGAHVVKNSISFDCAAKGFDQNNAYEAMYIFNNLSFGNGYNYRFPTEFKYGTMYMRNNVGFRPTVSKGNHEFLSVDKPGYQTPNTSFNSWTTLDGCDPIKEGNKVGSTAVFAKDYTSEYISLAVADFKATRENNGSLPRNGFGRLKAGSVLIDKGEKVENFTPKAHSPGGIALPNITIPYVGANPDFGPYEVGDPIFAKLSDAPNKTQRVYQGTAISPIVFVWDGEGVSSAIASNLPTGLVSTIDVSNKSITISGIPTAEGAYTVSTVGGSTVASHSGTITIATELIATLSATDNTTQSVESGKFMKHIVFTYGGGATAVSIPSLPAGVNATLNEATKTLTIHGNPTQEGSYSVTTVGGDGQVTISGMISLSAAEEVVLDWYKFQENPMSEAVANIISFSPVGSGETTANGSIVNPNYADPGSVGSVGALQLSKGGSEMVVNAAKGISMLKIKMSFTGDRNITVTYGPNAIESSWSSGKLTKGSYEYDLTDMMGKMVSKSPTKVVFKSVSSNSGNVNIHDIYLASFAEPVVESSDPAGEPSGTPIINSVEAISQELFYSLYQTGTALVVQGEIAAIELLDINGRVVAQSQQSQVVETSALNKGVYIVRILGRSGQKAVEKIIR